MANKLDFVIAILLLLAAGVASGRIPLPIPPSPIPRIIDDPALCVLIIEEDGDRAKLTKEQLAILRSVTLREAIRLEGGKFRLIDDDQIPPEPWASAMARPRTSTPWLIVSGQKSFEGPLPADIEAVIAIVKECK